MIFVDSYIILLFLFVIMIIESTIGFGGALMLLPIMAIFMNIQTAIVLMGFWGLATDSFKTVNFRRFLDKEYIIGIAISGLPGIIIGSFLISVVPVRWLKLFLGIFILSYSLLKIISNLKNKDRSNIKSSQLANRYLYLGGFSYGLLSGLIGAAGPINVALLERTGHERESFIANFAGSSIILSIVKILIYVANGLYPIDLTLLLILGIPIIFCSARIGKYLAPKIPKNIFKMIVFILLLIISAYTIIQFF